MPSGKREGKLARRLEWRLHRAIIPKLRFGKMSDKLLHCQQYASGLPPAG